MSVEVIIFYILLIDALGANLVVHFGRALPRDLALVPAGRGLGALLPGTRPVGWLAPLPCRHAALIRGVAEVLTTFDS
jgi:hypothetical protein